MQLFQVLTCNMVLRASVFSCEGYKIRYRLGQKSMSSREIILFLYILTTQFWAKVYLILYPPLENTSTRTTIACNTNLVKMVERFLNNSAPICKILTRELIKDQITTIRFFHSLKPLSPGIVQEARSFDKTDAILQNRNNEAVSVIFVL